MEEPETQQEERASRRSLITGALVGIPVVIAGTLTGSIGSYLLGGQKAEKDSWADAGDISEMQDGTPRQVRFERALVDGWQVRKEESSAWVIIDESQRVTAFSPLCTHLGCAYRWQADKKSFACPCHGSAFNVQGDVIAGPASRPLDRYLTKLEGDRLWLGPVKQRSGA
jgi:menaquinol-cytochrome c reductase iron-sulfur subunit